MICNINLEMLAAREIVLRPRKDRQVQSDSNSAILASTMLMVVYARFWAEFDNGKELMLCAFQLALALLK